MICQPDLAVIDGLLATSTVRGVIEGARSRKRIVLEAGGEQAASVDIPAEIAGPFALQVRFSASSGDKRPVLLILKARAGGNAVALLMGTGSVDVAPLSLTIRPVLADLGESITFNPVPG